MQETHKLRICFNCHEIIKKSHCRTKIGTKIREEISLCNLCWETKVCEIYWRENKYG